jgi:probable phosphoglycerate mutase
MPATTDLARQLRWRVGKLILVRHGSTALNKKGPGNSAERIRGWTDVPLDKEGQREAVSLATKYAKSDVAKVYTSDLQRAVYIAQAIAKAAHVPVIETDQLRPWNLGILNGKHVHKVIGLMNQCVENPKIHVPEGEPFESFVMRYLPFLDKLLKEAAGSRAVDFMPRPIIAVTHSRNLQLAKAWDKKGRPADYSYDVKQMLDYKEETPPGGQLELTT